MRVPVAVALLVLSPIAYGSCGAIAEVEAQIEQMRSMDVPEATIEPMVAQLETMKADNPECGNMDAAEQEQHRAEFKQDMREAEAEIEAEHDIKPDYFEQSGQSSYGDCSQYESMQTLTLCQAAHEQYSAYWEAASSGEASPADVEKMYRVHSKTAQNLIKLVENLR